MKSFSSSFVPLNILEIRLSIKPIVVLLAFPIIKEILLYVILFVVLLLLGCWQVSDEQVCPSNGHHKQCQHDYVLPSRALLFSALTGLTAHHFVILIADAISTLKI